MSWRFWKKLSNRSKVIIGLLTLAIIITAATIGYTRFYMTKERRFWTAIENGLKTTSITKSSVSTSTTGTQEQLTRLRLGDQAMVEGKTTIIQKAQTTSSKVVTTNIATPTEGFVRYDTIETNEKSATGKDFDFSSVVGQWAAQDGAEQEDANQAQVFAESFVQLIPIANLNSADRREVIKQLKQQKAYEVNFSKTKEDSANDLTVFAVTLNVRQYVTILRDMFKKQGLADIAALNPDQYDPANKLSIQIAIDGGNSVRKIAFSDDQYESYSDYGLKNTVSLPTRSITYTELQQKLQAAQ